jgi:hypothetical protein
MAGIVILFGHYIDFFNMIMPATVGDQWFIGVSEISIGTFLLRIIYFCCIYCFNQSTLLPKEILTLKKVNIFIINI